MSAYQKKSPSVTSKYFMIFGHHLRIWVLGNSKDQLLSTLLLTAVEDMQRKCVETEAHGE